jgi:hypothetical protein
MLQIYGVKNTWNHRSIYCVSENVYFRCKYKIPSIRSLVCNWENWVHIRGKYKEVISDVRVFSAHENHQGILLKNKNRPGPITAKQLYQSLLQSLYATRCVQKHACAHMQVCFHSLGDDWRSDSYEEHWLLLSDFNNKYWYWDTWYLCFRAHALEEALLRKALWCL